MPHPRWVRNNRRRFHKKPRPFSLVVELSLFMLRKVSSGWQARDGGEKNEGWMVWLWISFPFYIIYSFFFLSCPWQYGRRHMRNNGANSYWKTLILHFFLHGGEILKFFLLG